MGGVIYVDADACPVRGETETVAARHRAQVRMVTNGGIRPSPAAFVETVFVAEGPDAADDWIAERAGAGDVVVTADIPLAARVIESGAAAVKPDGTILTAATIGPVLATRNLMTDLRAADPFRRGGGRPFSAADRSRFREALEKCLRASTRSEGTPNARN